MYADFLSLSALSVVNVLVVFLTADFADCYFHVLFESNSLK